MTWHPNMGEVIGIEMPFTDVPTNPVPFRIEVSFPDVSPTGSYVFPSLHYELHGGGVDPSPRLLNQNSSLGGDIVIEPLVEKLRVYLKYDAVPGPLGTLPAGAIRKSLLTVKPGGAYAIPSLGNRVHELILDSGSRRITMLDGTVLAVPLEPASIVSIEPCLAISNTYHKRQPTSLAEPQLLWTRFDLVEPIEHSIALTLRSYIDPKIITDNIQGDSGFIASELGTYHLSFLTNVVMGTPPYVYQLSASDVVTKVNKVNTIPNRGSVHILPAGTKAFFIRALVAKSLFNGAVTALGQGREVHSYVSIHMAALNDSPVFRGASWRIPAYTHVDGRFMGQHLDNSPWGHLVADFTEF